MSSRTHQTHRNQSLWKTSLVIPLRHLILPLLSLRCSQIPIIMKWIKMGIISRPFLHPTYQQTQGYTSNFQIPPPSKMVSYINQIHTTCGNFTLGPPEKLNLFCSLLISSPPSSLAVLSNEAKCLTRSNQNPASTPPVFPIGGKVTLQ